jgi:hypothetical protein
VSKSRDPEEWVSVHAMDPELARRVADGEYEIDPQAVAEAMLRRHARLNQMRQLSRVLVARQLDRAPRRPEQQ